MKEMNEVSTSLGEASVEIDFGFTASKVAGLDPLEAQFPVLNPEGLDFDARIERLKPFGQVGPGYVRGVNDRIREAVRFHDAGESYHVYLLQGELYAKIITFEQWQAAKDTNFGHPFPPGYLGSSSKETTMSTYDLDSREAWFKEKAPQSDAGPSRDEKREQQRAQRAQERAEDAALFNPSRSLDKERQHVDGEENDLREREEQDSLRESMIASLDEMLSPPRIISQQLQYAASLDTRKTAVKGLLIRTDGTTSPIEFSEGTILQALYDAIGCDMVEVIGLADGSLMYLDEEGKVREGKSLDVNEKATRLLHQAGGHPNDEVVGNVVLLGPTDDEGYDTDYTGKIGSKTTHHTAVTADKVLTREEAEAVSRHALVDAEDIDEYTSDFSGSPYDPEHGTCMGRDETRVGATTPFGQYFLPPSVTNDDDEWEPEGWVTVWDDGQVEVT